MIHEKTGVKRWLPLAVCCLPGIVAAAVITFGAVVGISLDGPLSGLLVLAILACPLTTFLVLARRLYNGDQSTASPSAAGCCVTPSDFVIIQERLAVLRAEREALESKVVGDP